MTTYLVIEYYKEGKIKEIYKRFEEDGRMLPEGVELVDSWVETNFYRSYQIVKADRLDKLMTWTNQWTDLMEFDIIPVLTSDEMQEKIKNITE